MCDLDEWYMDTTGRVCPNCHEDSRLHYKVLPNSRLMYETFEDGIKHEHVEHMGEQRDYKCGNCETVWLMNHGGDDGA